MDAGRAGVVSAFVFVVRRRFGRGREGEDGGREEIVFQIFGRGGKGERGLHHILHRQCPADGKAPDRLQGWQRMATRM